MGEKVEARVRGSAPHMPPVTVSGMVSLGRSLLQPVQSRAPSFPFQGLWCGRDRPGTHMTPGPTLSEGALDPVQAPSGTSGTGRREDRGRQECLPGLPTDCLSLPLQTSVPF